MVRIVDVRVRGDEGVEEDAAAERDGEVDEMRIAAGEEGEEEEEIGEGKVDTGIGEGEIEAEDSDSVVVV